VTESSTLRSDPPRLQRSLKLWHLVVYGIIIVQPTAPMGIYGVVSNIAHGHVATTVLIAMLAMLLTAISYGRMARVYPRAGSAFTYVSEEIDPRAGYLVGWAMLMDYLLNPVICIIWCSQAARNIAPGVPYPVWVAGFALLSTWLNTRGIQTSGRLNAILSLLMGLVAILFLGLGVRYIVNVLHPSASDLLRPFYDPGTFSASAVFRGTSVAVLTYIGFDGISTMAEEVEDPRRNILIATVLTCVIIGVLSVAEVYVAQLAWPFTHQFPPSIVDTAFVHVASRVGGGLLFHVLNATLLVANFGSAVAAQFGASRLMYSMANSRSLPSRFFGAIDPIHHVPRHNVLLVGGVALLGSFLLSYERGAELLNFGAFIAFIGVNAAAAVHYGFRSQQKVVLPLAIPVLGILVCLLIWLHLSRSAQIAGSAWICLGLLLAYRLRRTASHQPPTPPGSQPSAI